MGYLDSGLTCSPELIVITDEIISMNRRTLEGIEVDEEALGLDAIAEAGPAGDFLASRHTRRHVRALQWQPTLFNRVSRANWEAEGAPDVAEKARRKALRILAEHAPEPLPPGVARTMDGLVEAFVTAGA